MICLPAFRGPELGGVRAVARNIHSTALFLKTLNLFSTLAVRIRENHPLFVYVVLTLLFALPLFWLSRSFDLQRGRAVQLLLT